MRKHFAKAASRVTAAAAAAVVALSMASPVMAATQYDTVSGTTTTFNKYLIVSAGDQVPNVTFSYTVAAGAAVSTSTDDNAVFQVLPGVNPSAVTVTDTTFGPNDSTSTDTGDDIDVAREASERAEGLTADTGVQFEASKGEKYATQQATVDFSNVEFDEPGIYRYIITEIASAEDEAAGIMHDNDVDRVLDVYVTDDGNGSLVVSQYVMHTEVSDPAISGDMGTVDVSEDGQPLTDKTDGFTNEYKSKDLVFKKEVTGNQASRDKYFEFTLSLENLNASGKYTVSIADDSDDNTTDGDADATSGSNSATIAANTGKENVLELTADEDGSVEQKFYLQHGQYIAVRGLPLNSTYNVTENAEDYKADAAAVTNFTDPVSGTVGTVAGQNQAVKTSYKNTRSGNIPTGVLVSVLPGLALAGVGAAGFAGLRRRKREDKE